jgi:hypothetical protein
MLGEIALLNRIGREAGTWRQLFGIEFPAHSPRGAPVAQRTLPNLSWPPAECCSPLPS